MRTRFFLGLLAGLCLGACAGSSTRMIAPARPPISPAEVRVYRQPPRKYQEIAFITGSSGPSFFHASPQSDAEAIERMKEQAAKVGANGVLLTLVADRPSGSIGIGVGGGGISGGRGSATVVSGGASGAAPLVSSSAEGIAIYVPDQR